MATTYVVLQENPSGDDMTVYEVVDSGAEANNAITACRQVAETLGDAELSKGVTLIAIPARNWNSGRHTLKAETTRRIRSA